MHDYRQREPLIEGRNLGPSGESKASQLAHRARIDSSAARTTCGKAGLKKSWLRVPRLTAERITRDTPGIRLQRRAS
jgi:hypothetical protein